MSAVLAATVTFLPSFLLAIISTLDLTNKKSLSILISHPYLALLPTFTFFSYAKIQCCGDRRIAFSSNLSIVNLVLNTVLGILFILTIILDGFELFMIFFLLPFLFGVLFTLLFLYLDKISCCSCCGSAGRLVRVFDPDLPHKTFILEEGSVVELTDKDLEQGGHMEMTEAEAEEEAEKKEEKGEADLILDVAGETKEEEEKEEKSKCCVCHC